MVVKIVHDVCRAEERISQDQRVILRIRNEKSTSLGSVRKIVLVGRIRGSHKGSNGYGDFGAVGAAESKG